MPGVHSNEEMQQIVLMLMAIFSTTFQGTSLPSGLTALVESDVIEQRVVLKARADPQFPARVQLFVAGIDFIPKRAFGQEINPDQQISLRGPMSGKIPFGAFDVLWIRICALKDLSARLSYKCKR